MKRAAGKKAKTPRSARRPFGGVIVNADIPAPRPPGGWVDETKNHVTGELFRNFRPRPAITFDDGVELVRRAARRQGIPGDGYRSRGPVLWAMHVLKLDAWYLHSLMDGALWDPVRRRPLELSAPRARKKRVTRPRARAYKPDPKWGF